MMRTLITVVLLLAALPGCRGREVEPTPLPPPPSGRWRAAFADPDSLTTAQQETMDRLRSIGYVSGSRPARQESGVVVYDSVQVEPGANLLVSGHFPGALLVDARGKELHRWSCEFRQAFPEYLLPGESADSEFWRRAWLLSDGRVLAIFEGLGLVCVDRESRVLWTFAGQPHHDLDIGPDGSIFVLTRRAVMHPRHGNGEPILEDFITRLSSEGVVESQFSLLEAFADSPFMSALRLPPDGDLFHTNTLFLGRDPSGLFRSGTALISLLQPSALAVVDLTTERVVWSATGSWRAQHDPSVTANARVLFLDNRGLSERSRVLELDSGSGTVVWSYGETESTTFYTFDCGAVSRLPAGNTLIVESNAGRAFEVTTQGDTVWEYLSPFRAGPRNAYVATLFSVERISKDRLEWLY